MTGSTRDKLATERAITDWRSLAPHHDREAVFLVDHDLDLLDAAVAVAEDDSAAVAAWLGNGRLARPTEEQVTGFASAPDTPFVFLIVQPFVLVALLPTEESS